MIDEPLALLAEAFGYDFEPKAVADAMKGEATAEVAETILAVLPVDQPSRAAVAAQAP